MIRPYLSRLLRAILNQQSIVLLGYDQILSTVAVLSIIILFLCIVI